MNDIFFTPPASPDSVPGLIGQDDLNHLLVAMRPIRHGTIHCHGDWTRAAPLLAWFAGEARKQGLELVAGIDSGEGLDGLLPLLQQDVRADVSLTEAFAPSDFPLLRNVPKLGLFLPLSHPEAGVPVRVLSQTLENLPAVETVRLGVGWGSRFSGPLPIDPGLHGPWARAVLKIVESITAHSLRTGNTVRIEFDCGLRLCMFDTLQLGALAGQNVRWPIAVCPRNFVLFTDGAIQPCLRLRTKGRATIDRSPDFSELRKEVDAWVAPYLGFCDQSEALDCRCLRVGSCSTGCVEHGMGEWK